MRSGIWHVVWSGAGDFRRARLHKQMWELSNNKENMGEHFKEHYQFAHVVLMTDYTDECLHSFKNWQEWKCWTKDETAASQAIKLVPSIQGKSLPLNKSDVLHEGGNLWRSKLETQSEM